MSTSNSTARQRQAERLPLQGFWTKRHGRDRRLTLRARMRCGAGGSGSRTPAARACQNKCQLVSLGFPKVSAKCQLVSPRGFPGPPAGVRSPGGRHPLPARRGPRGPGREQTRAEGGSVQTYPCVHLCAPMHTYVRTCTHMYTHVHMCTAIEAGPIRHDVVAPERGPRVFARPPLVFPRIPVAFPDQGNRDSASVILFSSRSRTRFTISSQRFL